MYSFVECKHASLCSSLPITRKRCSDLLFLLSPFLNYIAGAIQLASLRDLTMTTTMMARDNRICLTFECESRMIE